MSAKGTTIAAAASVALVGLALAGLLIAEGNGDAQEAAEEAAAQAEAELTLEEAVALAEKQIPGGKVVEAEVDAEHGVAYYVIGVEKDGLRTVTIAARTGKVLGVAAGEEDDRGFFKWSSP
jgi:uncharacterized membrane protein YkoI